MRIDDSAARDSGPRCGGGGAGCSKEKPAAPATGRTGQHGGMAMPAAGPGPVTIAPEVRARLGILVVTAEVRTLTRDLRLVGRVVPAETAQRTVASRVDGFVERLAVDFTGRPVHRGEVLLELYSPMLVAAQQELLLAVRLRTALGAAATPEAAQNADSLVAAARRRLQYWDISDDQIAELERSGTVRRTLTLRVAVGRRGPRRRTWCRGSRWRRARRCSRSPTSAPCGSRPTSSRTTSPRCAWGRARTSPSTRIPGEVVRGRVGVRLPDGGPGEPHRQGARRARQPRRPHPSGPLRHGAHQRAAGRPRRRDPAAGGAGDRRPPARLRRGLGEPLPAAAGGAGRGERQPRRGAAAACAPASASWRPPPSSSTPSRTSARRWRGWRERDGHGARAGAARRLRRGAGPCGPARRRGEPARRSHRPDQAVGPADAAARHRLVHPQPLPRGARRAVRRRAPASGPSGRSRSRRSPTSPTCRSSSRPTTPSRRRRSSRTRSPIRSRPRC